MKNYIIKLEVLTPVHIGNGKNITKKDYVLKNGTLYIYDPVKLHSLFGIMYEHFLMGNETLTDFLSSAALTKNKNINSALNYSVKLGDKNIRKRDNINEFIKDAYGYPYIPGSSLKGFIRTALLAKEINDNPIVYSKFKNEPINKKYNSTDIEKLAFGSIEDNIFKNLRISDSGPIPRENLIISKKIDIFQDDNSNNKLNLCRECLLPGTVSEFKMNVTGDEEIFQPKYILQAINEFIENYKKNYLSRFNSYNKSHYGKNIIYLGGGTGFSTKTVNYAIYKDRALENISNFLDQQFRNQKHKQDKYLGISPRAKKATKVNNKIVEMGICRIGIENETD